MGKKSRFGLYVTRKETCPDCRGRGIITHPAWERYWDAVEAGYLNQRDWEAVYLWWSEEGYSPDRPPPKEIDCWRCEGRGVLVEEVPLEEALREVLEAMKEESHG